MPSNFENYRTIVLSEFGECFEFQSGQSLSESPVELLKKCAADLGFYVFFFHSVTKKKI